jgi:hydrogenase-4 component E
LPAGIVNLLFGIGGVRVLVIDFLAVVFLMSGLLMLAGKSIPNNINLLAVQSLALSSMAFYMGYNQGANGTHMFLVGGLTLLIKVVILPWVLFKLVYSVKVDREASLSVGLIPSILIGILLIGLSYDYAVPVLLEELPGGHLLSAALSTVLLGCFFMISRRTAISQLIGIVVMENGLFLCAVAVTGGMPLIIELGIFFDVLVGALVMGIMTYQIRGTFDTLDTKYLNKLKG